MTLGRRVAALLLVAGLTATGCGTRVSEQEVRAGVGSGPVTLDQASVDQLRTAAQPGQVPGGVTGETPPGAPPVPGATPGPGTPAQPGKGTAAAPQPNSSGGSTTPAVSAACTSPGEPLQLGQVGSFSGVFGPLTGSAKTALAIWVAQVNARGGVACHPIVLHAVDDGGDPSRGSALVGELVSNYKIQAFVGMMSLSLNGEVQAIERTKLPVVGGDMVSDPWFTHPQFFPQGAGLQAIVDGAVRQAIEDGKQVHGLLYCVEVGVCTTVAKMVPDSAKSQGAQFVYSSPVSLTQTDFTAQCQNAKNAGVQAFGMAVDGSAIARVARSCAALGYHPQFVTGGGVVSSAQAKDPGIRQDTMSTASSNAPWMLTDNPGQQEYAAALARYAPGTETDGPSMIAWAAGKLFEAAIERLGPGARSAPLTTADIYTGLGKIKNETLGGLSPPLTFSPGQKAAPQLHCVYFELDSEKGWTAPHGSTPVCTPSGGGKG
jgi:branched-chain amino acid transport system substrate-binding protein